MAISSFEKPYVLTDEAVDVLVTMLEDESTESPLDNFESKMATTEQLKALNAALSSSN